VFIFFLLFVYTIYGFNLDIFNVILQPKEEYKDDFIREMGLFGRPDGFDAWMKLNTHPTCSEKVNSNAIFYCFFIYLFFSFCVCLLTCTFFLFVTKG
jgi:hypothetical protein